MPEQKQTSMIVNECPLMIEGNSPLDWVYITFCEPCEYHQGIEQDQVLCSANDSEPIDKTKKRKNR